MTVHNLHYWSSKKGKIERIKVFKGIDYGFSGFETPFTKKLIEFFILVFKSRFYFVFSVVLKFLDNDNFCWPFMQE